MVLMSKYTSHNKAAANKTKCGVLVGARKKCRVCRTPDGADCKPEGKQVFK